MKKGLSVLLIAAALFGFYGGAVNLNDVLACKDYWEEEGEKSTADMNKLEDGLNQLKDNEQAYLDGLEAVADGEEALAQGEQDYAAGQAELAQGEADYAAAPGKLADARKQIAQGEEDLAAGEDALAAGYKEYKKGKADYAAAPAKLAAGRKAVADGEAKLDEGKKQLTGLKALIGGIRQVLAGYNDSWKPGYENLKKYRDQIAAGSKGSKDNLTALAAFLPEAMQGAYTAAVNDVAGDDGNQAAKDYKDFIQSTNMLAQALPAIQQGVAAKSKDASDLYDNLNKFASADPTTPEGQKAYVTFAGACAQYKDSMDTLSGLDAVQTKFDTETAALAGKYVAYATENAKLETLQKAAAEAGEAYKADPTNEEKKAAYEKAVADATAQGEEVKKAAGAAVQAVAANKGTVLDGMKQASGYLAQVNEMVNGEDSAINNQLLPGLKAFNAAATSEAIDTLVGGQDTIAGGVQQIAAGVMSSDTLKDAFAKNLGKDALTLLSVYSNSPNPLNSSISDLGRFYTQMEENPGFVGILNKALPLLVQAQTDGENAIAAGEKDLAAGKAELAAGEKSYKEAPGKLADAEKKLAAGEKELAAGKAKLAAGKKAYAQGLADFAAAPGKLEAGRAALAEGLQKLMDGRAELAAGKDKLAEYEDGEQQVRDGLATLMGTEPNGGLTSIFDRRNGDDDFDNGDEHLDLDEGLDAVEVGRGYQADSGVLITKEITNRAIGTAAGLGAGALAVLAAILSLLKKNKGAGISALLSAAAGGAGIAAGTSAGMEFSSIAGSAVGATPWIAFGVLAGVALIHAIAHFASKEA